MQIIKPVYAQITNPALSRFNTPSEGGAGFAFYISQLWKATVVVGAIAFLLYFVWGGLEWILGGGDPKKIEMAQKKITNGLIGLILLASSYAIVAFIQDIVGINILNIDWTLGPTPYNYLIEGAPGIGAPGGGAGRYIE